MKLNYRTILNLLIGSMLMGNSALTYAAGTAANTLINNTAVVDFEIGGVPGTVSASNTLTIEELLDVNVVWQDAANVAVLSPSAAQVLTFLVTNTGNGNDMFLLNVNSVLGGDDFDPLPASIQIWIDADGDSILNSLNDTLYDGTNGPMLNGGLAGSDAVTVFVLADIPVGQGIGALANVQLLATSMTADTAGEVGNVGAEIIGAGDGGVDANVGVSGGADAASGVFEVAGSGVTINKSITVIDTLGGTDPHPGATLRYTLTVNIAGGNPVDNLVITDLIPANTTYTNNSARLDGVPQTDADDTGAVDFTDFNISNPGFITVDLSQGGNVLVVPPASFLISFDVTID